MDKRFLKNEKKLNKQIDDKYNEWENLPASMKYKRKLVEAELLALKLELISLYANEKIKSDEE